MRYLLILLAFVSASAYGQSVGYWRYDTVVLQKVGGNSELVIKNATVGITGASLFNMGNGRTSFVRQSGGSVALPPGFGTGFTFYDSTGADSGLYVYHAPYWIKVGTSQTQQQTYAVENNKALLTSTDTLKLMTNKYTIQGASGTEVFDIDYTRLGGGGTPGPFRFSAKNFAGTIGTFEGLDPGNVKIEVVNYNTPETSAAAGIPYATTLAGISLKNINNSGQTQLIKGVGGSSFCDSCTHLGDIGAGVKISASSTAGIIRFQVGSNLDGGGIQSRITSAGHWLINHTTDVGGKFFNVLNSVLFQDSVFMTRRIPSASSSDSVLVVDANGVVLHRAQADIASSYTPGLQGVISQNPVLGSGFYNNIDVNTGSLQIGESAGLGSGKGILVDMANDGISIMGTAGAQHLQVKTGGILNGQIILQNAGATGLKAYIADSVILGKLSSYTKTRMKLTPDSIFIKNLTSIGTHAPSNVMIIDTLTGQIRSMPQSSLSGAFWKLTGTSNLTGNTTIDHSNLTLLHSGVNTFEQFDDTGGDINFIASDDYSITSPDVLLVTAPTLQTDTSANKYLGRNGSTGEVVLMPAPAATSDWSLNGNSISGSNFLGTTSNNSVRMYTNNTYRGRWDSTGAILLIGSPTFSANHALIVQGTTNSTNQGAIFYAANLSAYSIAAWNGFSSSGDMALTANTGNINMATLSTKGVGVNVTPTSNLHTTSFATAYRAITALRTLDNTDNVINCTANTFTVTLPLSTGCVGRTYVITNTGSGTITVGTTSSETFSNVATTPTTLTLAQYNTVWLSSANGSWLRISSL